LTATELLAPAQNLECGLAAIDAGADAVYIGAARFGARAKAGNSLTDIEALARHAHSYWARVYVTLNTLLYDDELPQAVRLAHQLHDIGVDGLIIQDVGLLECDLPPIPLIASTQMHNHTPERVAFLEAVGFRRAILARELSLDQIKDIRQAATIELETFVHGALCVSYSGQCLMSYAIGGRSGNRGECAQPCRRVYSLVDGNGKVIVKDRHLLSLRDFNLSAHLGDLLDAGVTSFKIEGSAEGKDLRGQRRQCLPPRAGRRISGAGPDEKLVGAQCCRLYARLEQDVQPGLHDVLPPWACGTARLDRHAQNGRRGGGRRRSCRPALVPARAERGRTAQRRWLVFLRLGGRLAGDGGERGERFDDHAE